MAPARFGQRLYRAFEALFPPPRTEDEVPLPRPGELAGFTPDPPARYCGRCGLTIGPGTITAPGCPDCRDRPVPWDRFVRLGPWEAPLCTWLPAAKYRGVWSFYPPRGRHLARQLPPCPPSRTAVVPVPMTRTRRIARGYNQAALLARALSREAGHPVIEALARTRRTPAQAGLTPSVRRRNPVKSIQAHAIDFSGWTVILVDDVKTTGATLAACARALKSRRPATLVAATVAVADPPNGR